MIEDKIRDCCGVFGAFNVDNAAKTVLFGLYALQHRGESGAGIASYNGEGIISEKGPGKIDHVFGNGNNLRLEKLEGKSAIGHVLHSGSEPITEQNCQPIVRTNSSKFNGCIAAAMNGGINNKYHLTKDLKKTGSIISTDSDIETIIHLIARSEREGVCHKIIEALSCVQGAYSALFLTKDAMYAARDPKGVKPLVFAEHNGGFFVSSETCAFDLLRINNYKEIKPGEILKFSENDMEKIQIPVYSANGKNILEKCVFEHIYFSRSDSYVFGHSVEEVRLELGRQLAKEHPAPEADLVIGIPDAGTTAAIGYSKESKIEYSDRGILRNSYVHKLIGTPDEDMRLRLKFNAVKEVIKGKKIVLVDDSIINGTTVKKIVYLLKEAKAEEIHLRIASPPVTNCCSYGVDMPNGNGLIAKTKDMSKIKECLGVDSLGYLSKENMIGSKYIKGGGFCTGCFYKKL